jgi:DNA-binding transcriptional ArsR family regulator
VGDTARIFKALADPTRRQILMELKSGEMAAGEIGDLFRISGPAISRHLAILKAADLVTERRDGNRIIYSLQPENLASCLSEFLGAICPAQYKVRRDMAKERKRK